MQNESVHVDKTNRNAERSEIADTWAQRRRGALPRCFGGSCNASSRTPRCMSARCTVCRENSSAAFPISDQAWDLDFPSAADHVAGLASLPDRLKTWLSALPTWRRGRVGLPTLAMA